MNTQKMVQKTNSAGVWQKGMEEVENALVCDREIVSVYVHSVCLPAQAQYKR